MFGMGFAEILIIGVIAILFLGPDKLPETMVQIAKFFKSVKTSVASAKSSIEDELHLQEIRDEADNYKRQLTEAGNELTKASGVDVLNEEIQEVQKGVYADAADSSKPASAQEPAETETAAAPKKPEVVTFAKKSKKLDIEDSEDETKPSENA